MQEITLSVVIPAYNEERRLPGTLRDIVEFARKWDGLLEIILSDDGSQDDTVAVARSTLRALGAGDFLRVVASSVNRGKGHAVRTGVMASRGRYVLFCDADGATPFREVARLLQVLQEGYDVAIGSRDLPESRVAVPQPWYRRAMGAAMRWLVRHAVVGGFKDTQCGFKLFTRQAALDIFSRQTLNGFSFDVEVLYLARQLGYSVREVPIEWHDRPGSKVHPIRSPLQMLRDLFLIRLRHGRLNPAARAAAGTAPAGGPVAPAPAESGDGAARW